VRGIFRSKIQGQIPRPFNVNSKPAQGGGSPSRGVVTTADVVHMINVKADDEVGLRAKVFG
jgi:hypothetical protein